MRAGTNRDGWDAMRGGHFTEAAHAAAMMISLNAWIEMGGGGEGADRAPCIMM